MKNVLRVEELFLFVLGIFLFNQLDYSWWVFVVFLLTPDIAMTGYAVNNRIGAISYNVFHHRDDLFNWNLEFSYVDPVSRYYSF